MATNKNGDAFLGEGRDKGREGGEGVRFRGSAAQVGETKNQGAYLKGVSS